MGAPITKDLPFGRFFVIETTEREKNSQISEFDDEREAHESVPVRQSRAKEEHEAKEE